MGWEINILSVWYFQMLFKMVSVLGADGVGGLFQRQHINYNPPPRGSRTIVGTAWPTSTTTRLTLDSSVWLATSLQQPGVPGFNTAWQFISGLVWPPSPVRPGIGGLGQTAHIPSWMWPSLWRSSGPAAYSVNGWMPLCTQPCPAPELLVPFCSM